MPITRPVKIAFRVAAGPRLGFGHVARCRAIAAALGVAPRLSIRGTRATQAAARRLGVTVLSARPQVVASGCDVLVVDDPSLGAGRPWIAAARRAGVRVVAVHDAVAVPHPADLVVDGSPRTRRTDRGGRRGGPRYAVLDARVARLRRLRPARREDVLVALGGGAHVLAHTALLVRCLAAHAPTARIAVAPGFTTGRRPRLRGARWLAPSALAPALAAARVAVVGGGLTALEASALGVPAIAVAVVPAQRPAIRALAGQGAILDGGALSNAAAFQRVARLAGRLWTTPARRRRLALAGRRLLDGQGAVRIARDIRRLVEAGDR